MSAYPDLGQRHDGQPNGVSAAATAAVSGTGVLTFTALSESTRYWAVAQVGAIWRWLAFRTPDPETSGGGGGGASASEKGVVSHGAVASIARPTGFDSVEWIGSVEPSNAIDGDTWVDTSV